MVRTLVNSLKQEGVSILIPPSAHKHINARVDGLCNLLHFSPVQLEEAFPIRQY